MSKLQYLNWLTCSATFAIFLSTILPAKTYGQQVNEQFGLAAGQYERQEYDAAITAFRDLIKEFPNTSQASLSHFFLAESLVQKLDYQSAYPAYQLFLKSNSNHAFAKRAKFRMAESAFRLNWYEQAANQLERFVQNYPQDELTEFAMSYLGEIRLIRREPQLAQKVFETAIQSYPYSTQSQRNRFGLARALQQQGNIEEALRFYQMLTTNTSNSMYSKALLQIGIIHYSKGDFALAEQALLLVLDSDITTADRNNAIYWAARTDLSQGNNQSAFTKYLKIVDQPFSGDRQPAVLFDAAIAASRVGEIDQSIDWLTRLQTTWPKSTFADDATQLKIELLYRQKEFEKAKREIAIFRSEFNNHPAIPTIGEFEGRIFYDNEDFDQTIETFQELLNTYGKNTDHRDKVDRWRYFLGLGYLGKRDFSSAATQFGAIALEGQTSEFRRSVLLALASTAVGLEQEQLAISFLERFLATKPTGSSADRARADLAVAYSKLSRWDEAKRTMIELENEHADLETVLETKLLLAEYALVAKKFEYSETCFAGLTDSSYPRKYVVRGLSGLAWVRMSKGQQESSLEVFRKIIDEHGESEFAAESAMACGRYFEQNGDFASAMSMYELVLDQYSSTEFSQLAELRLAYCRHQIGGPENVLAASRALQTYIVKNDQFIDEAHYQLAWLYVDSEDHVQAMNHFWEVATKHPSSKFWCDSALRVAQWQSEQKNFDEARKLAQKLLEHSEAAAEIKTRCQFLLGQIAVHEQNWPEVESKMQSVLASTDDEALRRKTRYWLAESFFQQSRYEEALADLENLVGNPDLVNDQRQAWIHLRKAQTLAYLQKWTKALEVAISGKTEYGEFEAIHEFDFVCGRAHAAQGRLDDARNAYQQVVDSATGRMTQTAAMSQWRIGETYFHQEEFESAIDAFFKVDSLYAYEKWRAAAIIEAGKCQEQLGNWKQAMKLYQRLIEKFPDSEFRVAAQQRLGTATRQAARTQPNTTK